MEMLKVAGPEGTAVGRWRKTRAEKGEKRRGKKEKKETKKHHWGKVPLFYTYFSQMSSTPYDRIVLQPTVRPLYRSYQAQGNLYIGFVHPEMIHVAPYLLFLSF